MVVTNTVFDLPETLNRSMGDVAFLRMMLEEFQNALPEFMASIAKALNDSDLAQVTQHAHQLKGAAANMGAKAVCRAALGLEQIGKSGDPVGGSQKLQELQQVVEEFNRHVNALDWALIAD